MGKLFLIFIGFHRQYQPKTTVHFICTNLYIDWYLYKRFLVILCLKKLFCFFFFLLVWWFGEGFSIYSFFSVEKDFFHFVFVVFYILLKFCTNFVVLRRWKWRISLKSKVPSSSFHLPFVVLIFLSWQIPLLSLNGCN